ncbi:MAG: SRPBCC family protein [Bacteroidota bacterium]|nr:SRPBCC family protein [Bacteroidota bacterium]
MFAPNQRCFDLARSIDVHMASTGSTNEKAIAGVITGLICKGETVTWKAKHLGFYHKLTTLITEMEASQSFTDEQQKGPFKKIHHRHFFEFKNDRTIMTDVFEFESPFGIIGKLFDKIYLQKYLYRFLSSRNAVIKRIAESDEWRNYV